MYKILLFTILVTLCFAQRPTFNETFVRVPTNYRAPVSLECTADGEEPIEYNFVLEEKYLKEPDIYSVCTGRNSKTLNIKSVVEFGIYSCQATNFHGMDTKFFLLVEDVYLNCR